MLAGLQFNGPVNTIKVIVVVTLPNHTFPGQALSSKRLTSDCAHYFARE